RRLPANGRQAGLAALSAKRNSSLGARQHSWGTTNSRLGFAILDGGIRGNKFKPALIRGLCVVGKTRTQKGKGNAMPPTGTQFYSARIVERRNISADLVVVHVDPGG